MNEIATPTIENKIREIEKEILPYTEVKKGENIVDHKEKKRIQFSRKIYIIIPIVLFLILVLTQPNFIKKSTFVKGKEQKNFCFQKLLLFWLIFTAIACAALFAYNYKSDQNA